MEKYIIAHDLGTSGNKATLFTISGKIIKSAVMPYPVDYFNGNWAEQDANDWWNSFCTGTKTLLKGINPKDVMAVSFSGNMMGCLCVDKHGHPLRKSIIWADMRAEQEEKFLLNHFSSEDIYRITGHRASRSYSIEKLMWVKNNEPDIYEKTHKMLNAKDYIVYKLTGEFLTDYSDASGTNAFDLNTFEWSEEIINVSGVDRSIFPDVKPATYIAGEASAYVASECGLAPGTKIILGGGDGSCASVGAGSISEGITYNCLGSSSWISTVSKKPFYDKHMRTVTWAHVIPGLLIPSGTMQTAGAAFSWASEHFCQKELIISENNVSKAFELINEKITNSAAGSNGLLFLPYLLGERCPRWNSNARGAFIGLKIEHKTGDIMRSVFEGIAMNLNIILDILKEAVDIKEMLVVGGLAQGDIQQQILADIYNIKIIKQKHLEEATSIGAAVIAGVGAGLLESFESASIFNSRDTYREPISGNVEVYGKVKPLFEKSYQSLLEIYEELSSI